MRRRQTILYNEADQGNKNTKIQRKSTQAFNKNKLLSLSSRSFSSSKESWNGSELIQRSNKSKDSMNFQRPQSKQSDNIRN